MSVCIKATKCLNRLCRAMFGCTQEAKALIRPCLEYRALVRPCLEYACAVWIPYTVRYIDLLESVQNRAACWIKSYWDPFALKWSKSSTICTKELNWPSLKIRRKYISVLTLYSILNGTAAISFTTYFQFNKLTIPTHSLTLILASSTIKAFFFCCYSIFMEFHTI